MPQSAMTVRLDSQMKRRFDELCVKFGMSANTAINVFGLSVSLMFVILIGLYYEHETSVDKHYPERERIMLVHSQKNEFGTFSGTSREIIPLLRSKLPQIETA